MPAVKGQAPNNPDRGSKKVFIVMKSGPNKGRRMHMRVFIGPDGKRHSAPIGTVQESLRRVRVQRN